MLKSARILVIDDDTDVLTAVRLLLKQQVAEVITEKNPENIPSLLTKGHFDLVLLDMNFKSAINSGNEGLYWLGRIKSSKPALPVIMITAYGAIDLAVKSLKQGAADFVVKPWKNEHLIETITGLLDQQPSKRKGKPVANQGPEIIGDSPLMQSLFHKVGKIAPTDANILILGENGTGKDLIASAIHQQSARAGKPFVKVDVGALTDTLFESELFGHKKGAFTDAREDREGRIESANHGTLFLDEIGNISLVQQAKLLTVLQNRQVTRLGSNQPIPVDIRLLSATNVPLVALSDEIRFRKDLIYRINTVEIQVPPLRDRGTDILLLARHFIQRYAEKYGKTISDLDKKAETKLLEYHYPGNVRELQYSIERAIIMSENNVLGAPDLLFSPIEKANAISLQNDPANTNLTEMERITISKVVEKYNGNISKAAIELGITRTALYRRLSKYNL
ncbi:DNA-binding transcriptional response regulator, NtrC family, contains REC, AAA-type ATPase, and a Fis-type DNA-binding domains [bacterium A37T11]|nr:DNA-binding transcriptional response regulator, NtrC family, contains REC, AAA-type ATPase, and a Fis-type DNA-binding domains [bacterium A37T11]